MRLQFGTNGASATGINATALEQGAATGRRNALADNAGSSDRINLSSTSSIINRDAVNRFNRIQQLSAAVQAGTYQVSSQAVGASIVSAGLSH